MIPFSVFRLSFGHKRTNHVMTTPNEPFYPDKFNLIFIMNLFSQSAMPNVLELRRNVGEWHSFHGAVACIGS